MNLQEATAAIRLNGKLPPSLTYKEASEVLITLAHNAFVGHTDTGPHNTPLGLYTITKFITSHNHRDHTFTMLFNGTLLGHADTFDQALYVCRHHFLDIAELCWWLGHPTPARLTA